MTANAVGNDSRYGSCPVCGRDLRPRQTYCTVVCRVAAFRRRRQQPRPPVRVPKYATVYECPSCDRRYLGKQRCEDCNVFARRVGPGGSCPHCDEPVAVNDLLEEVAG